MYKYVQKAEGESADESGGLLLKEVSFQGSFESVYCGCFAEREGKGVPGDCGEGREGARADGVFCLFHCLTSS